MSLDSALSLLDDFVNKCPSGKQTIFLGFDPGSTGAFALVNSQDPSTAIALDIPTVKVPTGKKGRTGKPGYRTEVDLGALCALFDLVEKLPARLHVIIEKQQPMPRDTALTAFSVGKNFGMWPLFLYSKGISHDTVSPGVWKRAMGLSKKDKEFSRMQAQKLFPNAELHRKKDHNRAEALLLAEHARRISDGK